MVPYSYLQFSFLSSSMQHTLCYSNIAAHFWLCFLFIFYQKYPYSNKYRSTTVQILFIALFTLLNQFVLFNENYNAIIYTKLIHRKSADLLDLMPRLSIPVSVLFDLLKSRSNTIVLTPHLLILFPNQSLK